MTLKGLDCFYKHMFEKLGWMVLLKKQRGNERNMLRTMRKIQSYIDSIQNLHESLSIEHCNLDRTPSEKRDLKIMKRNVEILLQHATEDLLIENSITNHIVRPPNNLLGGAKKKKGSKKN